jgi:hypothetical protein
MAIERPPGAIGFLMRIKMQHHSCDFAPVSTFRIRVEQAQIRDDVLLVVNGQYGIGGRGIGDIGIKQAAASAWAFLAIGRRRSSLCWAPLQIDDRIREVYFSPESRHRQRRPSGPKSATPDVGPRKIMAG